MDRRTLLSMAVFFFLYLAAAEAGAIAYHSFSFSPAALWPAVGIALAGVVLYGARIWPAIALGALAFHLLQGAPLPLALGLTLGNTAQPVIGAYMLRFGGFNPMFARMRDTLLLLAAVLIVGVIGPFINVSFIFLSGVSSASFGAMVWTRWIGDMLSIAVLTPLIIRWVRRPHLRTFSEVAESAAAIGLTIAISILMFWTPYASYNHIPLVYLILFPLMWISIRLGPRMMTLGVFLTASIGLAGVLARTSAATLPVGVIDAELFFLVITAIFLIFVSSEEERKEAAQTLEGQVGQLEVLLEQIRSEDRRKNEFIAILAHELRNPLAAIRTSVEVLGLEERGSDMVRSVVVAVEERIRTMARLLDDLLDISRISQKKLTLQREHIDARSALASAAAAVEPLMASCGHELFVAAPEECPVFADPMRLEQILTNLLTNAAKYTPGPGRISVSCGREGPFAVFAVSDTGIGIPPEMIDRIFEPFVQINRSTQANSGVGIGLSLTRQLVEMHGGSIVAESAGPGQGSTFVVRIPLALEPAAFGRSIGAAIGSALKRRRSYALGARAGAEESSDAPMTFSEDAPDAAAATRPLSILVVDDNQLAAQGIAQLLTLRGHRVDLAYDGKSSLVRAREQHPDAVILDIGLPDISGYAVARALKRDDVLNPTLIALTGYGQEEDRRRAAEAGFDYHLTKPVGLSDIEAVLAKL